MIIIPLPQQLHTSFEVAGEEVIGLIKAKFHHHVGAQPQIDRVHLLTRACKTGSEKTTVIMCHDLPLSICYSCVCVCVCARARARVRAYVRACVRACIRAHVRACGFDMSSCQLKSIESACARVHVWVRAHKARARLYVHTFTDVCMQHEHANTNACLPYLCVRV